MSRNSVGLQKPSMHFAERLLHMDKKLQFPTSSPFWFDNNKMNEPLFCQDFLSKYKLACIGSTFFTEDGMLSDLSILRRWIFNELKPYISSGVSRKIENILNLLKIQASMSDLPPQANRIHVLNGTLFLDGTFTEEKDEIVRNRFPVRYNPAAPKPVAWLQFLSELLWPEDIPTLQEFIGYCLIPSNAGQKMMLIKGKGGEGKSQIGNVLSELFGTNAKNGSVGKISENQFARADLEYIHLMIDDDMRLKALKQTHYIKSIVTAKGKMDLERKGKQSYQGYMYARILAFSNGDLVSLYDQSDGFFRRQLILTTKPKPHGRNDDSHLSEKLCEELEGIFLWAFEGLQRLVENDFRFTESDRERSNLEMVKRDANNLGLFMEASEYIERNAETCISSAELFNLYKLWCDENADLPLKNKTFIEQLKANQDKYGIEYTNSVTNRAGRRVRGFKGLNAVVSVMNSWPQVDSEDHPLKKV